VSICFSHSLRLELISVPPVSDPAPSSFQILVDRWSLAHSLTDSVALVVPPFFGLGPNAKRPIERVQLFPESIGWAFQGTSLKKKLIAILAKQIVKLP